MSDVLVFCRECFSAGLGFITPVYSENEDGSGQRTCPNCLRVVMWHSSEGKLDLGIVRDSVLTDPLDYEVFAE